MILVNQYRDSYTIFDKKSILAVLPVVHDGVYFGYNLICDGGLVGTYDTAADAWREIDILRTCDDVLHCASVV